MIAMVTSREESIEEKPSSNIGRRATERASTSARVCSALTLLLESHEYAEDLAADLWDFAVELTAMRALGLTNSDFRWLIGKELVNHAREVTLPGEQRRVFRDGSPLALADDICFVLSKKGIVFARQIASRGDALPRRLHPVSEQVVPQRKSAPIGAEPTPNWNRDRRELRLGAQIVKQFKVSAANEETILAVFQEENWPPRIDDPLPPQPDQDSTRRVHDTISSLNRHQKQQLIRFLCDSGGRGIRWERVQNLSG
jgi:hypothetical protein